MLIRRAGHIAMRRARLGAQVAVALLAASISVIPAEATPVVVPMSSDVSVPNHLSGVNRPNRPSIMVVGDSIPTELMDTIGKEAKKRDLNVVPVAFGGCSVVGLYQLDEKNHSFTWSARCATVPQVQSQAIKTYQPSLVVWYSGREKYTVCTAPTKDGCAAASKIFPAGSRAQHLLLQKSMVTSFKRLTSKGAKLVIVLPTPRGLTATGTCAADPTASGCAQDPRDLAAFAWMEKAYLDLAAAFPMKIKTVTVADLLCPDFDLTTGCPAAERAGSLIRNDGVHVAPSQEQWFVHNLFNRLQATGFLP